MSNHKPQSIIGQDGCYYVKCAHCGVPTGIGGAAIFEVVHMAREKCEHCHSEFVIVNDVPLARAPYELD
jgi:hypothetical protein